MTVDQWKSLFEQAGLSDADMHKWHQLFEQQHPQDHQSFLEWLNLDAQTITKIRNESR